MFFFFKFSWIALSKLWEWYSSYKITSWLENKEYFLPSSMTFMHTFYVDYNNLSDIESSAIQMKHQKLNINKCVSNKTKCCARCQLPIIFWYFVVNFMGGVTHEEHSLCLEVHGDTHSQIQLFLILAMFCPARYDVNEIFKRK